jgi:hypothetical protein
VKVKRTHLSFHMVAIDLVPYLKLAFCIHFSVRRKFFLNHLSSSERETGMCRLLFLIRSDKVSTSYIQNIKIKVMKLVENDIEEQNTNHTIFALQQ